MGFIKTLLLKRIWTEKTEWKMNKILSFVFPIAALLILLISIIWLLNMDFSLEELYLRFNTIYLWVLVLSLFGICFNYGSEILKIKGEIKDLKDKIKE